MSYLHFLFAFYLYLILETEEADDLETPRDTNKSNWKVPSHLEKGSMGWGNIVDIYISTVAKS